VTSTQLALQLKSCVLKSILWGRKSCLSAHCWHGEKLKKWHKGSLIVMFSSRAPLWWGGARVLWGNMIKQMYYKWMKCKSQRDFTQFIQECGASLTEWFYASWTLSFHYKYTSFNVKSTWWKLVAHKDIGRFAKKPLWGNS